MRSDHSDQVREFRQIDPAFTFGRAFLPSKMFADASAAFIRVCVDILVYDEETKHVFLPFRISKPMSHQFWFLGGRRLPGEVISRAAIRILEREGGIEVSRDRFVVLGHHEMTFPDRQEEPTDAGTHSLIDVVAIELTEEERERLISGLHPSEFDAAVGLRELGRDDLVRVAHEVVVEFYDKLFK